MSGEIRRDADLSGQTTRHGIDDLLNPFDFGMNDGETLEFEGEFFFFHADTIRTQTRQITARLDREIGRVSLTISREVVHGSQTVSSQFILFKTINGFTMFESDKPRQAAGAVDDFSTGLVTQALMLVKQNLETKPVDTPKPKRSWFRK